MESPMPVSRRVTHDKGMDTLRQTTRDTLWDLLW